MIKKIKDIVSIGVESGDFPGAHFCYIEGDKAYCDFVGNKRLHPLTEALKGNEIYDIASLSKVISTTSIILKMIERNELKFDTKVCNILKRYRHKTTTIKQLLKHEAGFKPVVHNALNLRTKDDLITQIYNEPFIYEPGTKIVYSDTSYMLLGFIIEEIYKEKLPEVANKEVFRPLNMLNTSYSPDKIRAVPTERIPNQEKEEYVCGFVHDERSHLLNGQSGHAGVFSTAEDISKFILSFLNDEKILNSGTKDLIFKSNFIGENLDGDKLIRSFGYQKFSKYPKTNNHLITHTGFTGCNMWIDNLNKRGFVLLSNAIHPNRKNNKIFKYREQILNLFYKKGE